jgi:hypothetical protein
VKEGGRKEGREEEKDGERKEGLETLTKSV